MTYPTSHDNVNREIENGLAQKHEGWVFVQIALGYFGNKWYMNKEYYVVENGIIYIFGKKGDKQPSGDTFFDLDRQCFRIEKFNAMHNYIPTMKEYTYQEMKNLFNQPFIIMKKEDVARIAHEANRAYSLTLGDDSHLPWDEAPEWQKDTTRRGVQFRLDDPTATAEDSHESWMKQKEIEGWKYGPVKDVEAKEHPSFLPYDQLPLEQQAKDYLFIGIVESLASFIDN